MSLPFLLREEKSGRHLATAGPVVFVRQPCSSSARFALVARLHFYGERYVVSPPPNEKPQHRSAFEWQLECPKYSLATREEMEIISQMERHLAKRNQICLAFCWVTC